MEGIFDVSEVKESVLSTVDIFDCGESSLNEYLKNDIRDNQADKKRLLVFVRDSRIVGFISIGLANYKVSIQNTYIFEWEPVVHIFALGIDKRFQRQNIGSTLLYAVLKLAQDVDTLLPLKGVTVVALRDALEFYDDYLDFRYLGNRPDTDFTSKEFYMMLESSYIRKLEF